MKLLPAIEKRNILQEKFTSKLKEIEEEIFYSSSNFEGKYRSYIPNSETDDNYKDAYLSEPDCSKIEVKYIVKDVLNNLIKIFNKYVNATIAIEETIGNENKVELSLNNKIIGKFSGTTLLSIENNLRKLLKIFKDIPTLDMSYDWKQSDKKNIFEHTEIVNRTTKFETYQVTSPATEFQQAVTHKVERPITVGKFNDRYFSSAIYQDEKDAYIEKIENFLVDVKKAKNKANDIDVQNYNIDFSKLI
jgi:hypothetical protein